MKILPDVNIKAIVFGAAIAAGFIIFGYQFWDWFYPFSAIGLLYTGYEQKNIKIGTIAGAFAATPIIILAFEGYMGQFEGFFATETGIMSVAILILLVGAVVGFVGAYAKRNRVKALEEYEKKQNIGKTKKKNKKANIQKTEEKTSFLSKIFKK